MEITEEEHEQNIVTSSSSSCSVIDSLDSKLNFFRTVCLFFIPKIVFLLVLYSEFLEKSEDERVLTPELEEILIQISKTGYSW